MRQQYLIDPRQILNFLLIWDPFLANTVKITETGELRFHPDFFEQPLNFWLVVIIVVAFRPKLDDIGLVHLGIVDWDQVTADMVRLLVGRNLVWFQSVQFLEGFLRIVLQDWTLLDV